MQKFSTQPSDDGQYEVIRWNELLQKWEPIEWYHTGKEAKERAAELNRDYNEELHETK